MASTRLLGVVGWPVRHSLSPVMHNAALATDDLDLAYVALPVPPEQVVDVVRSLGTAGFVGANVTVPHKQAVMAACDDLTDEARLIGAVNTLAWDVEGTLVGDNTDAVGLQRALDEVDAGRRRAVLFGTGGAARAAVAALVRRGAEVTVVGRRIEAAHEVGDLGQEVAEALPDDERHAGMSTGASGIDLADEEVGDAVAVADLVVNATPLGMQGEDLPEPFMTLTPDQTAYDLVYAPPDTPFLQAAAATGAAAHHGLSMLVHQAAVAYERWTGRPPPVEVMRAAAEAALGSH